MLIRVNGQPKELSPPATIANVVKQFGVSGSFAVALNGQFVSKSNYDQTQVAAADSIEILTPIQGG